MSTLTCGFIGLGLIGGSIAKALKQADASIKIIAYDINRESILLAKKEGVADIMADGIDESFSACDYLFLCAPVSHNDNNLSVIGRILSKDCILTDVGSVKGTIHKAVAAAGLADRFIGGHPMAGSERTGYQNAKALLLQNAYYILTPAEETSPDRLSAYKGLVQKMGAIPLVLSAGQHDLVTAGISHLPHIIASTLVNLIKTADSSDGIMKQIAAGGFKDITRIASSAPGMWQQICTANAENISSLLNTYIDSLLTVKKALDTQDTAALYTLFDTACSYRESFVNASSGPIKRIFDMHIDIADQPGALAGVVSLLASKGINIRNIGITHNREAAEGAMRIEFYDETSQLTAETLLNAAGYPAAAGK